MGRKANNKRHSRGYAGIGRVENVLKPPPNRVEDLPDLDDARQYAAEFGWRQREQKNPSVVIFDRETVTNGHEQINFYWTTFTVQSSVSRHPNPKKRNGYQMQRRNVSKKMLRSIFQNPRVHTDRGYTERPK